MPGVFALALLAVSAVCPSQARADERDEEIKQLRAMINALDQKLRALEEKQEQRRQEAEAVATVAAESAVAKAAASAPKITINDRGFAIASHDNAHSLRLRGLVQTDSRWYGDSGKGATASEGATGREGFVLRRARIIFEGQFSKIFRFQIVPEYGGSSFSLLDANVGVNLASYAQLRIGKFKAPVGLEQLQSDARAFFTERSLVSQLTPNRDVGVQLGGTFFDGAFEYQTGVFDGIGDGRSNSTNSESDKGKDAYARVFARPFALQKDSIFAGLGLGVAGSYGRQEGKHGRTGGYKTSGQQSLFSYHDAAIQDGEMWRVSPQAYYYYGPFGLMTEYVRSTSNIRSAFGQPAIEVTNKAWQIAAGYVLTGEKAGYTGVTPAKPFSLENGTWGALELVARFERIKIDRDVFVHNLADSAVSAKSADAWAVGLNWHLTRAFRFSVGYFQTNPDTDAAAPTGVVLKNDEKVLITRAQIEF